MNFSEETPQNPLLKIKPKLLILGHARHGKDTVAQWLKDHKSYDFCSSSLFVAEKAVWPWFREHVGQDIEVPYHSGLGTLHKLQRVPEYETVLELYEDRVLWRKQWYDAITAYNTPDRSRLGRELFAAYPIYAGLRNAKELHALKLHRAYDLCVWVDASGRVGPEPSASCTVEPWMADVILDNNGDLKALDMALETLYNNWIKPLEAGV